MAAMLHFASGVHALLKAIASIASGLMILMAAVICLDVVTRRLGYQVPGLGSTRLQELEWHFHTTLFALWIGYGYLRNVHVRVDVVAGSLPVRRRMWIELVCCLLLALPYAVMVSYFGVIYAMQSYVQMESSASPIGLPMRWIIKSVLAAGLCLLTLAVLATVSRLVVALFGSAPLAGRAAAAVRI